MAIYFRKTYYDNYIIKKKTFWKNHFFCPDFVVDVEPLKTGRKLNKNEPTSYWNLWGVFEWHSVFSMLFYFGFIFLSWYDTKALTKSYCQWAYNQTVKLQSEFNFSQYFSFNSSNRLTWKIESSLICNFHHINPCNISLSSKLVFLDFFSKFQNNFFRERSGIT